MHASDWLPTIAFGMAGVNPTEATGPRPVDGHSMWLAWTTSNTTSPRTEIIHQVVNRYCNGSTPGSPSVLPFGDTIRVGKYKLMAGAPGQSTVLPWPQEATNAVAFGATNGTLEPATDHCRAGGVKQEAPHVVCDPWCLFDIEADPSEFKDLASDPMFASIVAKLAARVREAAATGPPWAFPVNDSRPLEIEMCAAAAISGFYEPLREAPAPTPLPPPPPFPPSKFIRAGVCLGVVSLNKVHSAFGITMASCASPKAVWTSGWVREQPTLESMYLRNTPPTNGSWCVHIGVWPSNMTCRMPPFVTPGNTHTPAMRQCTDGDPTSGGNPVGSGFNYTAGLIRSLSCVDEPNACLAVDTDAASLIITNCTDPRATGWSREVAHQARNQF